MRKAIRLFLVLALLFLPGVLRAGEKFDGKWLTKMSCPAKGGTQGYAWEFPAVITDSNFRGEHGTAKLQANGLVASRKYATGIFTGKGDDYSYDVKAQFQPTQGTGTKGKGLGIEGRTCTFDFTKQ